MRTLKKKKNRLADRLVAALIGRIEDTAKNWGNRRRWWRFMHATIRQTTPPHRGWVRSMVRLLSGHFYSLNLSTLWISLLSELYTIITWASKSPYLSLVLWRSAIFYATRPWAFILTARTISYAVPVYLEHSPAVYLMARVSRIQSATTPIPLLTVAAIMLPDAQTLTFRNRVRNRVVSSTLYWWLDEKMMFWSIY